MRKAEFQGRVGYYDEEAENFFPEGTLRRAEVEGRTGLYDPDTEDFYPMEFEQKGEARTEGPQFPSGVRAFQRMPGVTWESLQQAEPSTVERALRGGLAETGKGVGTLTKIAGREMQDPSGPMRSILQGKGAQWLLEKGGKGLEKAGSWIESKLQPSVEKYASPEKYAGKNPVQNPEILSDPEWWFDTTIRGGMSMSASILPAFTVGKAIHYGGKALKWTPEVVDRLMRLGTAVSGGFVGGGLEAGGTYEQALQMGMSEPQARDAAKQMWLVSAGLNALSVDKALGSKGHSFVGKAWNQITKGMTESGTEGLEEPAQAAILGRDVWQGAKEATAVMPSAFVLGMMVPGAAGRQAPRNLDEYIADRGRPEPAAEPLLSPEEPKSTIGPIEGVKGQGQPTAQAQPAGIGVPRGTAENEAFLGAGMTHEDIFALDPDGPEMQIPGIAAYRLKHDALTGLKNRAEFFRKLNSQEGQTIVAQFDLDKFKAVNDFFSHEAGDTVLREVGKAVKALKLDEFIHRTGGEEFEAVGFKDEKHARRVIDKLTRYLADAKIVFEDIEAGETLDWGGVPFSYGIGSGIGREARNNADVELKRAKQERAELGLRPEGVELSPLTRLGAAAERVYRERRKAQTERQGQGNLARSETLSGRGRLDPWAAGDEYALAPVHAKDFSFLYDLRKIISGMEKPGKAVKELGEGGKLVTVKGARSVSGLPEHLKNTGIVKDDVDTINKILKGIPVTKNQYEKVASILRNHKDALGFREDVEEIETELVPASSLNVGDIFFQGGTFRKVVDVTPWENTITLEGTLGRTTIPDNENIEIDKGSIERASGEGTVEERKEKYGVSEAGREDLFGRQERVPAESVPAERREPSREVSEQENREQVASLMSRLTGETITTEDIAREEAEESPEEEPGPAERLFEERLNEPIPKLSIPVTRINENTLHNPDTEVLVVGMKGDEKNSVKTTYQHVNEYAQKMKGVGLTDIHVEEVGWTKEVKQKWDSFNLTAIQKKEKAKKPEQQGLILETKGKDLRAPERESKPVTMEELPLGRAMKEAADREKQIEISLEEKQPYWSEKYFKKSEQTEKAAKEPWEMTREEFRNEFLFHGKGETHPAYGKTKITGGATADYTLASGYATGIGRERGKGEVHLIRRSDLPIGAKEEMASLGRENYVSGMGVEVTSSAGIIPTGLKDPHKFIVKQALSENKPVPAEVLKNYPDLSERAASEKENQQNLYSFPGGLSKALDLPKATVSKGMVKFFDFLGERINPDVKEKVFDVVAGVPNFIVERHPARKPLYLEDLKRAEMRHADNKKIFSPDPRREYAGVQPVLKLSKENNKLLSEILVRGDRDKVRYTLGQLKEQFKANDDVIEAYAAARMMIERLQGVIIGKTQQIALAPYENAPEIYDKLLRISNDLMDMPIEADRQKYLAEITHEAAGSRFDRDAQLAIHRIGKFADLVHNYIEIFKDNPGYIPRVRDEGNFKVTASVRNPPGEEFPFREVFMQTTKTMAEAKKLKVDIMNNPKKYFPENYQEIHKYRFDIVENKRLSEDIYADIGGMAAREELLRRAIDKAERTGEIDIKNAEAISDALIRAVNEEVAKRGAGRAFIGRHESLIEGYKTENLDKVLISHVTGMVGWLNKGLYAMRGLRELGNLRDAHDVRWGHEYFKNSMRNAEALDQAIAKARGAAVLYFLGFNLKSMALNSFQHYMTAIPEFSRHTKTAMKQLEKARLDVMTGRLTDFDKKVLEDAVERGLTEAQYVRQITGAADQPVSRGFSKVVDLSMAGFQYVESSLNRKPAYLAAMRLFTGQKKANGEYYGLDKNGKPYKMRYEDAMKAADEFVRASHYQITRENEPEVVKKLGPVGHGLYTFQSHTANYLNWIFNRAAQGEVGVLGRAMLAVWALGGLLAAPFADEINTALEKLFGVSVKLKLRELIREYLSGKGASPKAAANIENVIMNGIPGVLGVNMSRSVQVNTPLPLALFIDMDKTASEKMGGVMTGLVEKGTRGAGALLEGDYARAAENLLPNAAGNIVRAGRMYYEGATTRSGKPIYNPETLEQEKYTGKEAGAKGLGFVPLRAAKLQEINQAKWNLKEHYTEKRNKLIAKFRRSKGDDDKVYTEIDRFNDMLENRNLYGIVSPITGRTLRNALAGKPDKKGLTWQAEYTEEGE